MAKPTSLDFQMKEEMDKLVHLQKIRESAKGSQKLEAQAKVDLHFLPPKPRKKKKDKKKMGPRNI